MTPDPKDPSVEDDREKAPDAAEDPSKPTELTAAEQLALYEKELKENDRGHQPC